MYLLFALLLSPVRAEDFPTVVSDRVVLVIEGRPVLASDIRFEEVLNALDTSPSPFWSRDYGDATTRLRDAEVLRHYSRGLTIYDPSDEAIRERLQQLRDQHFPGELWPAFLASWGVDETIVYLALRRRIIAERVLFRNTDTTITDREAWLRRASTFLAQVRQSTTLRTIPLGEPGISPVGR